MGNSYKRMNPFPDFILPHPLPSELEEKTNALHTIQDFEKAAFFVRDTILPCMDALRKPCDVLETMTDDKVWPFPTYGKLLFGIL